MKNIQVSNKITNAKFLLLGILDKTFCCAEDNVIADVRRNVERAIKRIDEAELLLKENTGAITESAHFANTMLGEVPLQADSGGTGSVRQNEQTGKVCQACNRLLDEMDFAVGVCYGCSNSIDKPMDASA